MGKLSNIMENGIGRLTGPSELRHQHPEKRHDQITSYSAATDGKFSFWSFILSNKINRRYIKIAFLALAAQFIIFKILYPYPDFISDSYSYIATNIYNMDVNLWPIGYSKFLRWVHAISYSDTFLVAVQYLILETSLAYLYYTILYLFMPNKKATLILYLFLFTNPLFLYLSNCVLSDSIFTALTITLITQFIWIINKPNLWHVLMQGVIIGTAFTIRYTALYYPLIAICGFALSRHSFSIKVLGSLLGIALMAIFFRYTQLKTKEITGTAQFSVFGGWQLANNALYMYNHIHVQSYDLPPESRSLDSLSKTFFKKVNPSTQDLESLPGTYFIKVPIAILKPYMMARYSYSNPLDQFKSWGMVSPLYNKYGTYLIVHYPIAFARYFLFLNLKNYLLPHLEKFGNYNLEMKSVPPIVQTWFHYTTSNIYSIPGNLQNKIFFILPIVFCLLNFFYAGKMILFLPSKAFKKLPRIYKLSLIFLAVYLLLNAAFSIIATPIVLRYEISQLLILVVACTVLLYPSNVPNIQNT